MASEARVFLVEDEHLISMMTEDMLVDLGYEITATAANLASGLKVAAEEDFEIGVLDIDLHGKQSYPIAEILSERKVALVFVSGYGALRYRPALLWRSCASKAPHY